MATPIPTNVVPFSLDEIVDATGASVITRGANAVTGVTTDSRRAGPNQLFVALRGAHHDGHDHVAAADVAAALVDRDVAAKPGVSVLRVDDTLRALGDLARAHRARFAIPVIAITGSVGKTTTKELIAAALRGVGKRVAVTAGNLNNRIGAPLTLLTIDREHDAAVIEIGMNIPGEIAELTRIVTPTIGVVTAVAEVHTEGVGSLEGVAREKGALLVGLAPTASAIYTADDAILGPYASASSAGSKLSFGRVAGADVRLAAWSLDGSGRTSARIESPLGSIELTLAQFGEGAALNAAAAIATMIAIDPTSIEGAAAAIAAQPPTPGRLSLREGPNDTVFLDDSYNASARSCTVALEAGAALASARGGSLIAVLGDMLELGAESERLHAQVGRDVVRVGARALIACGEQMAHAGQAALTTPGSGAKVVIVQRVEDAAETLRAIVQPRDVILVKGSRGMRMERVIEALQAERAP